MDFRVNEVHSQFKATDSRSLLDPAMTQEIVRLCLREIKEELAREKRAAQERQFEMGDPK